MADLHPGKEGGVTINGDLFSMPVRRYLGLKLLVVGLWLMILLCGWLWLEWLGISLSHIPSELKEFIRGYGVWGPLLVLGLYVARTLVLFIPITGLTVIVGSIYGPVYGTVLNLIGESLTVNLAFVLGRCLGRRFVREHERGWVKKYDDLLRRDGFLTQVFMRALYFPFDLVNYGSGISGMLYRHYALGSLLGLLPSIIAFTVLGDALVRPRGLLVFSLILIVLLSGALWLRRTSWVRGRLQVK